MHLSMHLWYLVSLVVIFPRMFFHSQIVNDISEAVG
jgi:hypothetical protein